MFAELIRQLDSGKNLSTDQIGSAVAGLTDPSMAPETKADFLCALAKKGETADEIAGFARELRQRAVEPPISDDLRGRVILDVCGTGGDRLHTFNISTTVAIVVASAGVAVAKHGNRAITSQSGSADVLEELGVPIDLSPAAAAASLRDRNFAFFFAPLYHPAFKYIGPARKICAERQQRTIFNFLGPLLNPARPSAQLIGVPRGDLCEPVARVLQLLGVRRGMVVSGKVNGAWLDELSILGDNTIAEFYQDRGFAVSDHSPHPFGFGPATLDDLHGGERSINAEITRRILRGQELGPKRQAVLFNAGAALFVADQVRSLADGCSLAAELIDSGRAAAKLQELSPSR